MEVVHEIVTIIINSDSGSGAVSIFWLHCGYLLPECSLALVSILCLTYFLSSFSLQAGKTMCISVYTHATAYETNVRGLLNYSGDPQDAWSQGICNLFGWQGLMQAKHGYLQTVQPESLDCRLSAEFLIVILG